MKLILSTAAIAAAFAIPPAAASGLPRDHAWKIDPAHSSVLFKVKHAGTSWFYGSFTGISGTFSLDAEHVADGKVTVEIDTASVATRDDKRDQHLRGPDFLDAKQFPAIAFASKKIAKDGDGFVVSGELTLRGETKPLTLRVQKTGEGEFFGKPIVGYETSFTIKRSEFGMNYGVAEKMLGDEVQLTIAVEAGPAETK